jgi:AAA+ superfamily predicted ATPase
MSLSSQLPSWAEELRNRYLAGEASMFLVHGNARDVHRWTAEDGTVEYVSLRVFLERFLSRSKDIVVYYNVSEGLEFPDQGMGRRFRTVVNVQRALQGRAPLEALPIEPNEVLPVVEDLVTDQTQRAAVILDYIEMVVPMGDLSFMGSGDKANLVALQRWASDPGLLQSDNLVVMVTENLSDVHRRVAASAQLATLRIPLPSTADRTQFLRSVERDGVKLEMDDEALANVTAGLSLLQIRGLFRKARQSGETILFRTISRRKKAIIEQECHGLVEFVDPKHNFSHVGGLDGLKQDLMRVANAIKKGQTHRVPMGVLFVGPMGTGKTFVAEAFAAESGLTCLKFKNFREKWVGSTEGNLEKILGVVDGLGYVLLIIDEADRSLGAGSGGDGGTSSRVIARLKEFMSDTTHRGRVVMLAMTNRPDKLDVDLKRPGRFDLKIPFFFPEIVSERRLVLEALVRKNKLSLAEGVTVEAVADATAGYSGAELEAVLLAAAGLASDEDAIEISAEHLLTAVSDVIPSRDTRMLEFMEMLAVFESSSRRMLPERYREMDTEEVQRRLDVLRAQLGPRAAAR